MDFNSHAPCGARLAVFCLFLFQRVISTHTPLAGRDTYRGRGRRRSFDFNSHAPCGARQCLPRKKARMPKFQLTRPLRGATCQTTRRCRFDIISTHTPLAGRDLKVLYSSDRASDFNSHAPCGARLFASIQPQQRIHFNSHAPCGARLP